jgi:hypothetical protein
MVNNVNIPLFCLAFNHPFGGAGFLNHPQYHWGMTEII